MDSAQASFCFESLASDAGGKNSRLESRNETIPVLPTWATSLNDVLSVSLKTAGWNNRWCPPQRVALANGCDLIVVPAHLWQPRSCVRREAVCYPIAFPRAQVHPA